MPSPSKITATKKGDFISLVISFCRVTVDDNLLSVFDNPEITQSSDIEGMGIINGSSPDQIAINIGVDKIVDLAFDNCTIDTSGRKLSFACEWVCFKNCTINADFSHQGRTFEVSGSETGSFCIFKDGKVKTDGLKRIKVRNVTIEFNENESTLFSSNPNTSEVLSIEGGCKTVVIQGNDTTLNFTADFYAAGISFGIVQVEGIKTNKFSSLRLDHLKFSIKALLEVGSLAINDGIFSLEVENTDLSKTKIRFSNNAALKFGDDGFKSTASVWQPSTIEYRGFSPRKGIEKLAKPLSSLPAREFFCEMKTYFSSKGDSITAGEFYAAEMKAHRAYLSQTKWRFHHDRITMFLAYMGSNFGQNWFQAFVLYGIIGFIVAQIILGSSRQLCCFDLGQFYAHIFSPLTIDFNDVRKGLMISSWFSFLWIAWKITAGYLIYQIIISTRRFIRKW